MAPAHHPWHPIETVPRNRRVDLWAVRWTDHGERLAGHRFSDCRWSKGGSIRNPAPRWTKLPAGWRPTHWMEPPAGPSGSEGAGDPGTSTPIRVVGAPEFPSGRT